MQQALLSDPGVQKAMADAGKDALQNPEVQAKMAQVASEKFPQMADDALNHIQALANDPEASGKALAIASYGAHKAVDVAEEGAKEVYALLQQGPKGVRILAFFGSVGSLVLASWKVVRFWNGILNPIDYVLCFYMVMFSFISAITEANPEHLQKIRLLDRIHDNLIEYCKFLSTAFGRGIFFLYQSSFWIAETDFKLFFISPEECLEFFLGCYLGMIGIFNLAMHWGIMPVQVIEKSREVSSPYVAQGLAMARKTMTNVARRVSGSGASDGKQHARFGGEVELQESPPLYRSDEK